MKNDVNNKLKHLLTFMRINQQGFNQQVCYTAFLLVVVSINACTWVEVDEHGLEVQAISNSEPAPEHCQSKGQVEVSVLHEIAFYDRDEEKIEKELLILARNEAGLMGANVIQPHSKPQDGRQRFNVFYCP